MKDDFELVHELLKQNKYGNVLQLIFNAKLFLIKPPYSEDLNHSWFIVGDIFYKEEKYEKAISSFKKSLEDWPEDVEAMLALSNCYSEINLPKKAEEILMKAKKIKPGNSAITYNLANALFDQGEYIRAIDYYNKIRSNEDEIYDLAKKNIKTAKEKLQKKSAK